MDNDTLKAYAAAVQGAFQRQQVLQISYSNEQEQISTRKIVPCSPFVVNSNGTVIFNAYSEVQSTTGRDRGPGVVTFRLDRILSLELDDFTIEDVQGFWSDVLGNNNGGTVVFPSLETPLFRGKFPAPTVATAALPQYLERGWTTEPRAGAIQKQATHVRRLQ